jgi:hypothetical protein
VGKMRKARNFWKSCGESREFSNLREEKRSGRRFLGSDEIGQGEGAKEFADGAAGLERTPAKRIAAGNDGKLMDGAVGMEDGPAGRTDPALDLDKPLAAVKGLIVATMRMTEMCVSLVEAHEIEIVGSGEKEAGLRTGDTIHFADSRADVGKMFDGFAGDDEVEGVVGERQTLSVGLYEPGFRSIRRAGKFAGSELKGRKRKIATGDGSAAASHAVGEAATAAGEFQNAQACDIAEVLANQLVPRSEAVVASGVSIVVTAMPSVIVGAKAHPGMVRGERKASVVDALLNTCRTVYRDVFDDN